ncbi:hypothetical protein CDG81_13355 [Actinopolyspora erythraea]|uniref:Peptidase M48 domain-containing protein n=1 Tax=Actinopolyspora erythraea TaxID=414996 RepID=A0A223RTC6_9ACTN|nr:hypothetical protein CDG81_13355 [Actinopolyspora erythraea]
MTAVSPPIRLDERAVPAGTTTRFASLVILIMVSSSSMTLTTLVAAGFSDGKGCLLASGNTPFQQPPADLAQSTAYQACVARYALMSLSGWIPLAVPGVLFVTAGVLFFCLPVWKTRGGRGVPLQTLDHDGQILRELEHLAQVAGLSRVPRFVVDPGAVSSGAVVFGRNRRPSVCLHGALLARRSTSPERFRTVLLHEFAHIHNRDVTLTYATVALWRAFIAVVLVPYAVGYAGLVVSTFLHEPARTELVVPATTRNLLLPLFMVVLVYLARSDVLRTRELHADVTAFRWGADPHNWSSGAPHPTTGRLRRALGLFTELWHTHPRWELRRDALTNSGVLFGVSALPMGLSGAAAILINGHLGALGPEYGVVGQPLWNLVVALPPAVLITGIAGSAVARAVVHGLLTGRAVHSSLRAGLWLGAGMVLGESFLNRITISQWLAGDPVVVVLLVFVGIVFVGWVTQCARLWASVWQGRTIRPPMLLVLAVACLALSAWFWWWQSSGIVLAHIAGLWADPFGGAAPGIPGDPAGHHSSTVFAVTVVSANMGHVLAVPLMLPAVTALWVVPLLAWTTRLRVARWIPSVLLEADGVSVPGASLPRLRRVALSGLLGGGLSWIAIAAVKAYMHTWQPSPPRQGLSAALVFQGWTSAAVVAGAAVAALVASMSAEHYRLIVALIAAQFAVLAGYSGLFLLSATDGCIPTLTTFSSTCGWRPLAIWRAFQLPLSGILVLATAVATIAAALVAAAWRPRARHVISAPHRKLVLNRWVVGVLCTGAVGITTALLIVPAPAAAHPNIEVKNPTLSAKIQATQVVAWYSHGGQDLLLRHRNVVNRLGVLASEAKRSADGDAVLLSGLRPVCVEFGRIAQDAGDYFPAPAPQIRPAWQKFIALESQVSHDCLRGLDRNEIYKIVAALKKVRQATIAANSVGAVVDAISRDRP